MATNLKENIRSLVDSFSNELEALFRRAALEAVSQALGTPTAAAPRRAAPVAAPAPRAASAGRAAPASHGKRIRRSPAQLDQVAKTIHDYVSQNPGLRAEQIKAALKLRTKDWALPVKKLIDEGQLVAKGEKRATTYVAKGGKSAK